MYVASYSRRIKYNAYTIVSMDYNNYYYSEIDYYYSYSVITCVSIQLIVHE